MISPNPYEGFECLENQYSKSWIVALTPISNFSKHPAYLKKAKFDLNGWK